MIEQSVLLKFKDAFFIALLLMPTLDCGSLSVAAAAASGNASADITNEDVEAVGCIISAAVLCLFVGVKTCTDFNRLLRLSINNFCASTIAVHESLNVVVNDAAVLLCLKITHTMRCTI